MTMTKDDLYIRLLNDVPNASATLGDRSHIYVGPVKITITDPINPFDRYSDTIAELKAEYISKTHVSLLHVLINDKSNIPNLVKHINKIVEGAIKDVQSI